jgi:lambda family phage tail tape measure protein
MAMNMDALLRIKADVQGENNIRRLGNSMQGLQGQVKNAADRFGSLKGAVAGFGAAIAGSAIVGGLSAIVKGSIDAGDELFNLQAKTGVAASALIGIGNAAKLADVDMATLGKGLTKLNINLVRAAEGNDALARQFAALGISVKDANGKVAPTDKVLAQIADRFADMPDGAQKAAAAVALFGKAGADLIPLLNEGADSMEQFTYKVSDDFAARSDLFNDTITELGIKTQGFGMELTDALLPALQSILEVFGDLFDTDQDWTALFKVIEGVIRGIAVAIYTVVKAVDVLIKNVVAAVQAAGQALSGDFGGAWQTITSRVSSGIAEAQQAIKDLNKLAFGSAPSPGTGRRTSGRGLGLDTSAADKEAEAAAKRAAAEAKRAAAEQARLEERRRDLGQKALGLQQQLRESLEDLNAAYAGVGANEFDELALRRNAAITDNNRLVDKLTRDVVELALEINEAGGQIDIKPFEDLINKISEGNVALADKEYQQGLKEIGDQAAQAAIDLLEFTDAAEAQQGAIRGARDGISSYLEGIGTLSENISSVAQNAFKGLEDAIVSLTTTGKFSFKDFALSIINDLTRMVTRMLIIAPILQFIQSLIPGGSLATANKNLSGAGALSSTKLFSGGLFANGGTFANGIQPFAAGGIVDQPTLFKFASGGALRNGLMGEAGPEAIIPLRRGRDGKLGVAGGGGSTSVTVNVDASGGTQVAGNPGQAEALGRAVSQAVQNELIRQKRPGGLLAA